MRQVCVVDYGIGNIASLVAAFDRVGVKCVTLQNPNELDSCSHLVLPGVGAFGAAMKKLEAQGWVDAIIKYASSGRSILGICLGMQILAAGSFEGFPMEEENLGDIATGTAISITELVEPLHLQSFTPGLGLIAGEVLPLKSIGWSQRVPHTGWNTAYVVNESPLLEGLPAEFDVYFTHSYGLDAANSATIASTSCGRQFSSAVQRDNIMGTQFHPEKSSGYGLMILKNFGAM